MVLACLVLEKLTFAFFETRYTDSARCLDALSLIKKYGNYTFGVMGDQTHSVLPACQVDVNNVKLATN